MTIRHAGRQRGLTYIELLVVATVLAVLAAAIVPLWHWDEKRRRERHLRMTLTVVREAIDHYNRLCNEGRIVQSDVEQMCYPRSLDELIEGVEVTDEEGKTTTLTLLRRIPVDPMTGEEEWGMRSYQDDWDSQSWGGENLYDIYSLSDRRALDGTYYRDW